MDMDVPVVEDTIVDIQCLSMGLDVFEGQNGRFLHDVAKVTSEREFRALALRERGLDEENLTTHTGPCEARHHTCIVVALVDVAIEGGLAQEVLNLCGGDLLVVGTLFHLTLVGNLAESLVHLLFELANTTLTGVALDDHLDGGFVERGLQLFGVQTCILELTRDEVALGNLNLFLSDIATHLDDLHTVE